MRRRSCVHGEHSKGQNPLRAPPDTRTRALENLFCTKCHCQVPLPHNSAPPPRATKSRIANGAEHRPRWVLRHRGAAGAGAVRDRRSRSKHGGSPVRHPVLGDARGYASATCAEHSPTRTQKQSQLGRGCHKSHASGEGQPKILLRRAIGFQAPALAASQQTTVNGQIRCFSLPVRCSHSEGRGIEWAARLASLHLNQ